MGVEEAQRPGAGVSDRKQDAELRRYREAGAADAILYRFPERHARDESFFLTEMMEDYSNAVILEGKEPVPYADVSVYVAEPPDDGGSLLVRETRDRAREQKEKLDAMEHLEDIGDIAESVADNMRILYIARFGSK